jgi:hypothetical protein
MAVARETREVWPLLTVETEVNGNSKSTNERGPFLVGSLGLPYRYKRLLFSLGCSSRPCTKYFFPHRTLFQISLSPSPAAGQAAVLSCLFLIKHVSLVVAQQTFNSTDYSSLLKNSVKIDLFFYFLFLKEFHSVLILAMV